MKRAPTQRLLAWAMACWSAVAWTAPVQAGGGGQVIPLAPKSAPKATVKVISKAAGSELLGQWEVSRVLADLADQPHWGIRPGDASLLYRSMTISADKIWFVGDHKSCDQPHWQPFVTTWQNLFQRTGMSRTPSNSAPARATPRDYDLKVSPKQRAQAFLVCPQAGASASKAWRGAGWMALESPDSLVVRYSGQVLVVLRRRAHDEKPHASFSCEKASSPSEKAICSDRELAAWDRSVAEALRQVLEYKTDGEEKARVLREQMAWRAQRDKCGTDNACLRSSLSSRVTILNQE